MLWTVQEALCLERLSALSKEFKTAPRPIPKGWDRDRTMKIVQVFRQYGGELTYSVLDRAGWIRKPKRDIHGVEIP